MKLRTIVACAAITTIACGGEPEIEAVGVLASGLTTIPESGFVPFPIQLDTTTLAPKVGPDGQSKVSAWDKSLPDLLAADAYAYCATTGFDYKTYNDPAPVGPPSTWATSAWQRFDDTYLEGLRSAMAATPCPGGATGLVTPEKIWLERRSRAACNVDSRTNTLRAAPIGTVRDVVGYDTFTPAANSYWGMTAGTGILDQAARRASRQLGYADVSLCMAAQLREKLENPESLFLSRDEQAQMLAIIDGRTSAAVREYALLAKVATSPDPVPTTIDNNQLFLPLLRKWFDAAPRNRIVEDFGASIRLHAASLLDYSSFLRREASARWTSSPAKNRAEADFGTSSARAVLRRLLIGPDASVGREFPSGNSYGGYDGASIRDPLLYTLLGIARQANAVFRPMVANPSITAQEQTYVSSEVYLRLQECTSVCTDQAIRAALPPTSQFQDYLLWKRHGITPEHGRALFTALGYWARNLVVLGDHTGGDSTGRLAADFSLIDRPQVLVAASRPGAPKRVFFDAQPEDQGFVPVPKTQTPVNKYRDKGMGGTPVLALAREGLFEWGGKFTTGATFDLIKAVASELDGLIGRQTIIVRRHALRTVLGTCPTNESCKRVQTTASDAYVADVTTSPGDPYVKLAPLLLPSAGDTRHDGYEAALASAVSTSLDGRTGRAVIDGLPRFSSATAAGIGAAVGRELRSFSFSGLTLRVLLVEGPVGSSKYLDVSYVPKVGELVMGDPLSGMPQSAAAASAGQFGALASMVWATSPGDPSRPALDAFGIPSDWVPPADASLVGGQAGEGSYQYYLKSAEEAAQEAGTAVQKAVDGLLEQAESEVSVAEAETQAQNIAKLETRALCGPAASCKVTTASYEASVQSCNPACDELMKVARRIVHPVRLAQEVISAPLGARFSAYEGGELQRVLIRQLTARESLDTTLDAYFQSAFAFDAQRNAASAAAEAALQEKEAALAELDAALAALDQQNAEILTALAEITSARATIEEDYDTAYDRMEFECGIQMERAMKAGMTFSGVDDEDSTFSADNYHVFYSNDNSFSPGPWIQQQAVCQNAKLEEARQFTEKQPKLNALWAQELTLLKKRQDLTPAQQDAIAERKQSAEAAYDAARKASSAAIKEAYAGATALAMQLQGAMNELTAASVELSAVQLKTANAIARANLDASLASDTIAQRLGVKRRFRSYDLWRARALLESARRIAATARRAIESRFVVELSDIDATQVFVDAPSQWADTVYQSDLSPSASIGLTPAPSSGSGVYANKLSDYVDNLRRFVEGYTISNPTSVATPDSEVLTLVGPDARMALADGNGEVLSEEAQAWQFFCPSSDSWVGHPGAGEIPLVSPIEEACDGERPTVARRGFILDAWGSDGGAASDHERRHNVRWRRLAVNLVGTGVRDCEQAEDPTQCYSEVFLRFDLAHAGPAWLTDHAGKWQMKDLTTAFISSGKALAVEEWLDPVTNGWDAAFVANVSRGELQGRPLGGSYELTIELTRDVVLRRLERVQLLIESDYWVSQQ